MNPESEPVPAFAVSPEDQSSDRTQSDANQAANAAANANDRTQSDADQVVTVEKLDRLIATSQDLSDNAEKLSTTAKHDLEAGARQRRRFMWTMGALGAVVLAVLVGIAVVVHTNNGTTSTIEDCVQPTGVCFREGQARTGKAIQSINQVTIQAAGLAAACAPAYVTLPLPQRIVAIRDCIVRGLH